MTIETGILQDLVAAVKAAVAATAANTTLPVSYLGVTFDPPADQKYLEMVFIPNNGADRNYGEEQVYQGLLRLVLHWPNDGTGAYAPMTLIEEISGFFSKSERYGNVQIYDKPKLLQPLAQDKEMLYPSSMRYRSFQ